MNSVAKTNVGSMKVTMAISYSAILHSLLKQRSIRPNEVIGVNLDMVISRGRDGNIHILLSLGEVLFGVCHNSVQFPVGANLGACHGLIVECRQFLGYIYHHFLSYSVQGQKAIHHLLSGKLSHFHRIFNRLPFASNANLAFTPDYRHYFQVSIGGKASIEFYLLMAEKAALFQGGVVQIPQINGFLDLVYIITGEKEARHLSLHQLYPLGIVRIGFRFK